MNLYDSIEQTIRQHEEILHVDSDVKDQDVRHSIRWVMRDNPDIFWFVHQYYFDQERKILSFRYQFTKGRRGLIQKSIEDVVENDFQIEFVRTLGIYEQVVYVYKWLLTYCNYNVNSAYNQNIDSVFVRRNSVCTGYAKAAQYLFKLLGIESRLVFGRLNNDREDGRHCWNIVCINGIYYHLDICLGDLVLEDLLVKAGFIGALRFGDFNYNCFCVSTEEISKTRSIEDVDSLPFCNKCIENERIAVLSGIAIKQRNSVTGCLLSHIGSSADIYLCSEDKNVVLKNFRGDDVSKCKEEYGYMDRLRGCEHLIQLNDSHSDWKHNIIAIEQSTPIVDLLCSHYYHPTVNGVMTMLRDITLGWIECYQRGILYRDIHVCNIYKANNGRYKLGDFGSCTYELISLRERVGKPWFMSPETYISGQFDERSAVYSITALFYFILNGMRPPFVDGNSEEEALQRKMNGESFPEPALLCTLSKETAEAIMVEFLARGCAFYPTQRIQTCKELLHVIDTLRSTLKSQRIELRFFQQDTETILDNKTIPNVYIPRDIHHRFAYGEEVERRAKSVAYSHLQEEIEVIATTDAPAIVDVECNSRFEEEINLDDLPEEIRDSLTDGEADDGLIPMSDDVENHCGTMGGNPSSKEIFDINGSDTFEPAPDETSIKQKEVAASNIGDVVAGGVIGSVFAPIGLIVGGIASARLFAGARKSNDKTKSQNTVLNLDEVYSSIFAPAEVRRKSHMLVQMYLHLFEETEKVKALAKESDKNAERRDYTPLQCKLKKGDKVDVLLTIYGESLLMSEKKSMVWHGSFTKCSFDYFVSKDIDVDELSCAALLTVNGIPMGEMRFITRIVESPRQLNPEIIAHKYNKVFISYSHQDESKVKFLHEGLELGAVPHFFDRKYLKAGDVFPQVIQDYINSADLFILCWSENASKSEYVKKERLQALERAFPQVKPQQFAKLSIYPMSIEPRAELPSDMKDNYHFGEI